jgi:CheY-like chemotaxis protein
MSDCDDNKLRCILLIDDDEINNFITYETLMQMHVTDCIHIASNGKEALDYLHEALKPDPAEGFVKPEVIFLDINMPVMNGYQFLEEYDKIQPKDDHCQILTMLTTSMNVKDVQQALDKTHIVKGYLEKPVTEEKLRMVINRYWRECRELPHLIANAQMQMVLKP